LLNALKPAFLLSFGHCFVDDDDDDDGVNMLSYTSYGLMASHVGGID